MTLNRYQGHNYPYEFVPMYKFFNAVYSSVYSANLQNVEMTFKSHSSSSTTTTVPIDRMYMILPISSNGVFILHHFQDITTCFLSRGIIIISIRTKCTNTTTMAASKKQLSVKAELCAKN